MKINLLPWREQEQKQNRRRFFFGLSACLVLIFLILIILHIILAIKINAIQKENQLLQQKINPANLATQQFKMLQQQLQQLNNIIAVTAASKKRQDQIIKFLNDLPQALSPEIYLTQFKMNQEQLLLKGGASSHAFITALMSHMEQLTWVSEVKLTQLQNSLADQNEVNFDLGIIYGKY